MRFGYHRKTALSFLIYIGCRVDCIFINEQSLLFASSFRFLRLLCVHLFDGQFSDICLAAHALEHIGTGLSKAADGYENGVEVLVATHFETRDEHKHATNVNRGLYLVNAFLIASCDELATQHISFRVPNNLLVYVVL